MDSKISQDNQAILLARAKKLETVETSAKSDGPTIEVLVFELSGEIYGIEVVYVKEIRPLKEITPLPCVPNFVYGLINIRRHIYSIVDLRPLFDLPILKESAENRLMILINEEMSFGLFVDRVMHLQSIPTQELRPHMKSFNSLKNNLLKGITKEMLIVLDGDKILKENRLIVNQKSGDDQA